MGRESREVMEMGRGREGEEECECGGRRGRRRENKRERVSE